MRLLSPRARADMRHLARLALLLLVACTGERQARTQLVVTVTADALLVEQLKRLEVRVHPGSTKAGAAEALARSFTLAASTDESEAGVVSFPFSFGVRGLGGQQILLVVEGFAERSTRAPAVIEQKLLARMESETILAVDVTLEAACFGAEHVCIGLDRTCYPTEAQRVEPGDCGRVVQAPTRAVRPRGELVDVPVGWSDSDQGEGGVDSGELLDGDIDVDALLEPGGAGSNPYADAGALEVDPGLPACDFAHECDVAHPCVPGEVSGYSCLGQFAEWPMHGDVQSGAKFGAAYRAEPGGQLVEDQVTGLFWQDVDDEIYAGCTGKERVLGDRCSWDEAARYCGALLLGGKPARLPSKIELESLIDETSRPLGFGAFLILPSGKYWTRSTVAESEGEAWTLRSDDGAASSEPFASGHLVRCVRSLPTRSGNPEERYVLDAARGTLTDTRTMLSWQRTETCPGAGWADAQARCAAAGEGFRLPTRKELLTLVDPTRRAPAIDPRFHSADPRANFWSATRDAAEGAWLVDFYDGSCNSESGLAALARLNAPATTCVRCVHD